MKIGFIDHFIDEWHANNYPAMIRKSKLGRDFTVAMAWDEVQPAGKKPLAEWCRQQGIEPGKSIEHVVASCDCLMVLSPDNPECQQRLAEIPLRSGKPVYIDKPFTADGAACAAAFATANRYHTPLMSCSSLRFTPKLTQTLQEKFAIHRPTFIATRGPGDFSTYAIHQLEMLVQCLGTGARRIMRSGSAPFESMIVDYGDDRRGSILQAPDIPFGVTIGAREAGAVSLESLDGFFEAFIDELLRFFITRRSPIPSAETKEILTLLDAGLRARSTPDIWLNLAERSLTPGVDSL
ncbi:MAG: oxidoreductase [Opitutaceae bacterium]